MLWIIQPWGGRPWQREDLLKLLKCKFSLFLYFPHLLHPNYSRKHFKRSNGAYGKLGDRVLVAIMGQKKKGIIVGMKAKQRPAVPRFDTNNIVLIEENGNPSGNRITAPLPNTIRLILQKDSNPKKADYTIWVLN